MFTKLKNGQLVKKPFVLKKKKKICAHFLDILWDEGFILGYKTSKKNPNLFEIYLKYVYNEPCIQSIKFVSKPGKRIYMSTKQLWKLNSSMGLILMSTNKGVLTIEQCKKLNVGGEPFAIIC